MDDYHNCRKIHSIQTGFTLIELMMAVAIVAIIAVIALPSYQRFITSTTRSQGKSQLLQIATKQEQFFLDNKTYATTLTDLSYATNPYYVNKEGFFVASGASDAVYKIAFDSAAATAFTIQAVPLGQQATKDTQCGTLKLSNTGLKTQSGTSNDCW